MQCSAFATRNLHPKQRSAFWAETNTRFFGQLETRIEAVDNFDAKMKVYQVGPLKVFRIAGSPHQVKRRDQEEETPLADCYKLVMRATGRGLLEQCGRRVELAPGDWSLYDPRLPYTVTSRDAADLLVMLIPRPHLNNFRFEQLRASTCADPRARGLYSICSSFLRSMSQQIDDLPDAAGSSLADTVLGLVTATLLSDRDGAQEAGLMPNVMRLRIKQYVRAHLADPALNIEAIAHEMRCSKRYLHLAFEGEGLTLDRYIWHTRLERSRELLESPGHRYVANIAYACGFRNHTHFCRAFKSRFGVPPSQYVKHAPKSTPD